MASGETSARRLAATDGRRFPEVFILVNAALMIVVVLMTLYPFVHILALSMSTQREALRIGWHIVPLEWDFTAYRMLLEMPSIGRAAINSILRTLVGTSIGLLLTTLSAYPLSKRSMPLRGVFTAFVVFPMLFSAGLIPTYLNVRNLGLINSFWALVLPGAISAYNLIIVRNFYLSIPTSLEESAMMDGASVFTVWLRIVLPLSLPVLATVGLWIAVGHWNAYFDVILYITDQAKIVLQVLLRRVVVQGQLDLLQPEQVNLDGPPPPTMVLQSALIIVTTGPILLVYPFVQRYFTKGIMLGAVKG